MLPAVAPTSPLVRLLRQLSSPLVLILLVSGGVALVLGEPVDAAVIFGVVAVNAVIGYLQEARAEAALDALRSMVRTRARVVRDGRARHLPSEELVPGDLVLVEAGDKVPADLRLIHHAELRVDESALTGESLPTAKDENVLPTATSVADRHNMLYSGTLVTSGTGTGTVVATGAGTELGEIHRLVGHAETVATPLTRKIARFSTVLTVVILGLAALTFAVGIARGEGVAEMFTAAVALAVGAIPEGLPAAVTITLAIGVARMAHRGAVIRRLPAVETLGSTTVICTDKTGTLTENQMTVRTVWTPAATYTLTGSAYATEGSLVGPTGEPADAAADQALWWTLAVGASCNDAAVTVQDGRPAIVGDPTEGAMLVAARKAGVGLDGWRRTTTIPFSAGRRYMATLHVDRDRRRAAVLVKGAVERVLELCAAQMLPNGGTQRLDRENARHAAEQLAGEGMRVLAVASRDVDAGFRLDDEKALAGTLTFIGLQAMLAPPRPAAIAAVQACRQAGIAVKMITGEVSPEQKLRLVEALQARDHVVAMTGDGVNDAPALRQADIGVAMGLGGTDVAKDAADMVLTDDDFSTVEAAVEEGRGVFDNLTKFIVWTLPTNMAEGLVILVAILLGTALPILPTQILWINMTTAVALGLMLAFEPKEPGIMQRPPRAPGRPLLTAALVQRILLVSALLVGGAWWLFQWELSAGATLAEARTAAVNAFVAVELFYLFSCRTLVGHARRVGLLSNRWIVGGVAIQVVGQMALTYLPAMNHLFHTAPITGGSWVRILALATAAWAVVTVDKRLRPAVL